MSNAEREYQQKPLIEMLGYAPDIEEIIERHTLAISPEKILNILYVEQQIARNAELVAKIQNTPGGVERASVAPWLPEIQERLMAVLARERAMRDSGRQPDWYDQMEILELFGYWTTELDEAKEYYDR